MIEEIMREIDDHLRMIDEELRLEVEAEKKRVVVKYILPVMLSKKVPRQEKLFLRRALDYVNKNGFLPESYEDMIEDIALLYQVRI